MRVTTARNNAPVSAWRKALLICLIATLLMSMVATEGLAKHRKHRRPVVIPPRPKVLEHIYSELAAQWWQWALEPPTEMNPVVDETGEFCHVGQSGPIWFLAGNFGGTTVRTCTIPRGKFLFFPIVNVVCWGPEDGETEQELRDCAHFWMDAVTELECAIDGKQIRNLWNYRVDSPAFAFEGGEIFGLEPGRDLNVADGYWLLLPPLSKGQHVIEFRGVITFTMEEHGFDDVFETHLMYLLTVDGH